VGVLRDVFSKKAFDAYRGAEVSPGPDIKNRIELLNWVRETANTVHHLCGSCRMGPKETDVLDPELRVRGVNNLRVADASVFPSITSTNTAAPTMMIGERAADLLLN
jgi:choline dehydrogenase